MGFPKKLLGQDEAVVMLLRPHVKRLFAPVLLLLVVAPAATVGASAVPGGSAQTWVRGLIALAAVLILIRWVVTPFLVWWNTIYVITNRRLVMRHGVLTRSGHDMPLSRLNDVSFEHNLFERMLGCGTLTVESAGERGQVVLADVPRVERVQRVLYRLSDEARQTGAAAGYAGYADDGYADDEYADDADDLDRDRRDRRDDPDDRDPGDDGRRSRWGRRR